jgi:hypothetical protein
MALIEVFMHQLPDDVLMGLSEFRALTHLSPTCERRHRCEQDDWPPHVEIGRRIFYRRAGVMNWLARQETNRAGVHDLGADLGGAPELDAAISRRVSELAANAPALTAEQVVWLGAVLDSGGGGQSAGGGKVDTLVEQVRVR